jgi:hypothetical protein
MDIRSKKVEFVYHLRRHDAQAPQIENTLEDFLDGFLRTCKDLTTEAQEEEEERRRRRGRNSHPIEQETESRNKKNFKPSRYMALFLVSDN